LASLASLLVPERRALTAQQWLVNALGGRTSYTGRTVGTRDALAYSPVYACVGLIAETISTIPLIIYRRLPQGGKLRAPEHPLYALLHDSPNPEMTAVEFWDCLIGHVELRGNGYAEIERDQAGRIRALWPLRPDCMEVDRDKDTRRLRYLYRLPHGMPVGLDQDSVLHLRGRTSDGIVGFSPLTLHREAFALGLAIEEYIARFYGNSASPSGVLTHKGHLSEQGAKNLKESWEKAHKGLTHSHRVAVLEEGLEWQAVGMTNADAQFLESRKFQVAEIARIFRIPLHKIGDLDRSTNNNIEHQAIEFVGDTIRPRSKRIAQRVNLSLIQATDGRRAHFVEHLLDELVRGDIKSRWEAYGSARQNGVMTANEIRERENMNAIEGGDALWVPANMVSADDLAALKGQPAAGGDDGQTDD
jgi:HK97 family phage portal protein